MSQPVGRIVRPPQVGELAYQAIRDMLTDGVLAPGERLVEVSLTARLGISRTPVREALGRLATEGFLDDSGRQGYRVPVVGPADIYNMCQVRSLLEPEAARQAAANPDAATLAEMRAAMDAAHKAHLADNVKGVIAANSAYRNAWLALTDNPLLLKALSKAMTSLQLIRWRTMADPILRGHIMSMQRGLLERIEARDPEKAAAWQFEQLWTFYELIIKRLFQGHPVPRASTPAA